MGRGLTPLDKKFTSIQVSRGCSFRRDFLGVTGEPLLFRSVLSKKTNLRVECVKCVKYSIGMYTQFFRLLS